MARPRRETKQLFYDQFCDFEVADQAIVLELLQEFHRQKKRLARAVPTKTDTVASAARGAGHVFDGSEHCLKCGSFSGKGDCPGTPQGSLLDDPATESGNGGSR